ncbi:beta-glycosyl hydrolase / Uncharacterized esterase [hydrothermal vent metagenome]|uniref:beta-N-acetylhexosaminidase n=1 Tax=hydrothermal vent metagenome TaxID=652676 RepID=A0A3B0V569_9ZZZZ
MKKKYSWIDDLPIQISEEGKEWAKSHMRSMSLSQKIGQLIHVATWSNKSQIHIDDITHLIHEHGIGGLIFFQGDPERQAQQTNYYQNISKTPLMVSVDAEWGLGMRLDGVESFPYQLTLGAIPNNEGIYKMGSAVGKQLKRLGVHVNFAPVIDINTNPANPVINFRSYGENKHKVASRGISYMEGIQEEGVLACAKHFPGHGDTDADSHKELPLLNKSYQELVDTELYPFEKLIDKGIGAIMTAHLHIPQLDSIEPRASTLSHKIIDGLLKKELKFKGLVFTDALDMKAVSDHYEPGYVDVEALKAGNDVLVFVNNVSVAVKEIERAISNGEISLEEIELKCLKQLCYKYWMGLKDFSPLKIPNIVEDINQHTNNLNKKLYEKSITLIKDDRQFALQKNAKSLAILSLYADGDKSEGKQLAHHTLLKKSDNHTELSFESKLVEYCDSISKPLKLSYKDTVELQSNVLSKLEIYDTIIVAVHDIKLKAIENFGITEDLSQVLTKLFNTKKCQVVFFGNPYALSNIKDLDKAETILLTYQENKYTFDAAFKVITGQIDAEGVLPVSINSYFKAGNNYRSYEKK